jgi:hypothetical protein
LARRFARRARYARCFETLWEDGMRVPLKAVMLTTAVHFAALAAPSPAFAQGSAPAQPVPYGNPASPVPYGHASPPATPTPAAVTGGRAVGAGGDVIYLKSGGILRGTIVDAIPDAQARIQLATGEIATVPWPEIQRIEHATQAPAAPSAPAPAKTAPEQPMVWVHIDGPEDVRLQQDTTGNDDYVTVCSAPCDKQMPAGYPYRVVGSGLKASGDFTLHAQDGEHDALEIHGASKAWFVIGAIAIPLGLVVGYIGLLVGAIGSLASTTDPATGNTTADHVAGVGWTMFGLGAAAAIGGLVLVVTNWKTGVSQQVGTHTGLLLPDGWARLPTWRDATPEQRALPAMLGIPLVNGRF